MGRGAHRQPTPQHRRDRAAGRRAAHHGGDQEQRVRARRRQRRRVLDTVDAVAGVAVVKLNEAVALRDGGVRKPVLLMGPFDEPDLQEAVARDITPMVYTPIGDALDRVSAKLGKTIPIHVRLDTGMGRGRCAGPQRPGPVRDLAARSSVQSEGLQTTLTEDPEIDPLQFGDCARRARRCAGRGSMSGGCMPRPATRCSTNPMPSSRWCGSGWRSTASTRSSVSARWACSISGRWLRYAHASPT